VLSSFYGAGLKKKRDIISPVISVSDRMVFIGEPVVTKNCNGSNRFKGSYIT
jgi:hypothetical protein